jgi:hypothetical protein
MESLYFRGEDASFGREVRSRLLGHGGIGLTLSAAEERRVDEWAEQFRAAPREPIDVAVVSYPAPNRGIEFFASHQEAERVIGERVASQPADFHRPHILA